MVFDLLGEAAARFRILKSRLTNQVRGEAYMTFVKDSLRNNKPYDKFVHDLLTAEGRVEDDGAAGYFLRDSGMPLDNTANTIRIFLGTQIGCAQCHDHPFDKWTQFEFYEMASYTYGVTTRQRPKNLQTLRRDAQKANLSTRQQQVVRRIVQLNTNAVSENKYKKLKLPDDYKYEDAKPKQTVEPYAMFGDAAEVTKGRSARKVFADWLTDADNPRFAMTIANRLWARAMGVGIIDPVDDIRDDSKPSNPKLLAYLTDLMRRVDFDMRTFQQVVYNTKTYQRAAGRYEAEPGVAYHFPGPVLRRMSAEQIWDSVVALVVPESDKRPGPGSFRRDPSRMLALATGKNPDTLNIMEMSSQQIIAMVKKLPSDQREMNKKQGEMMRSAISKRMNDPQLAKWRGFPRDLVRASELDSPARPGHFLQEFGQSDRELIENSSTEPSVTQVLTMLNGPVEKYVLGNKESVLRKNVEAVDDDAKRIRIVFRSMFNRDPYPSEIASALTLVKQGGKAGYGDLVWAMFNTREFIFIQ